MKHRYVYRVVPLPGDENWFGGRTHYFSRSAAKHRVLNLLTFHGVKATVERSEPVEFLAPVIPLRSAS